MSMPMSMFFYRDDYSVTLIEVNSNPCLEFASSLQERLLTSLLEDTFKLAVDAVCPPPPPQCRTRGCEATLQMMDGEKHK